jgi:excisionase family DNA binding protein
MYPVNSQFAPKYLTPEQVAQRLGVTTSTVYAWISREEIQSLKIDKRRFFTEEQIADFQQNRGNPDYVDYRYSKGPLR